MKQPSLMTQPALRSGFGSERLCLRASSFDRLTPISSGVFSCQFGPRKAAAPLLWLQDGTESTPTITTGNNQRRIERMVPYDFSLKPCRARSAAPSYNLGTTYRRPQQDDRVRDNRANLRCFGSTIPGRVA